ncbi:hypothetical protein PoHVEF18_006150 [Penicillium ochrochloron]
MEEQLRFFLDEPLHSLRRKKVREWDTETLGDQIDSLITSWSRLMGKLDSRPLLSDVYDRIEHLRRERRQVLSRLEKLISTYEGSERVKALPLFERLSKRLRDPVLSDKTIFKRLEYEIQSLQLLTKALKRLHDTVFAVNERATSDQPGEILTNKESINDAEVPQHVPHSEQREHSSVVPTTSVATTPPETVASPDNDMLAPQSQEQESSDPYVTPARNTSIVLTTRAAATPHELRAPPEPRINTQQLNTLEYENKGRGLTSDMFSRVPHMTTGVTSAMRQGAQCPCATLASSGWTPAVKTALGLGIGAGIISTSSSVAAHRSASSARDTLEHTKTKDQKELAMAEEMHELQKAKLRAEMRKLYTEFVILTDPKLGDPANQEATRQLALSARNQLLQELQGINAPLHTPGGEHDSRSSSPKGGSDNGADGLPGIEHASGSRNENGRSHATGTTGIGLGSSAAGAASNIRAVSSNAEDAYTRRPGFLTQIPPALGSALGHSRTVSEPVDNERFELEDWRRRSMS